MALLTASFAVSIAPALSSRSSPRGPRSALRVGAGSEARSSLTTSSLDAAATRTRPSGRPSHSMCTRAVARSIDCTSGASRSRRRANTPPGRSTSPAECEA